MVIECSNIMIIGLFRFLNFIYNRLLGMGMIVMFGVLLIMKRLLLEIIF